MYHILASIHTLDSQRDIEICGRGLITSFVDFMQHIARPNLVIFIPTNWGKT